MGRAQPPALLQSRIGRPRRAWPEVQIIVRGDSGFCRQRLMRWCERHQVGYVLGLARNARLEYQVSMVEQALAEQYAASGLKQRVQTARVAGPPGAPRRVTRPFGHVVKGSPSRCGCRRSGRAARRAKLRL